MGGRDPHAYGLAQAVSTITRVPLPAADAALKIGVVDTGYAPHPWLDGHVEVDDDHVEAAGSGHGTFVAGVVLDHAKTATVVLRRALVEGPDDDTQVVAALENLNRPDIKLINLSFGGSLSEQGTPEGLRAALDALAGDVVVVAAVPNNASPLRNYPAADAGVLSVGATTASGEIAEFSACGRWITVFTRGEDVHGPFEKGFATWSGTSFAAAAVTGRIGALMESGLTATAARDVLLGRCETRHAWGVNGPFDVRVLL
ncbi:S8/S53 family peptidase [Lentzea sp. NPDC042327]|uniref:S8 family peptidase n=1 Tax=Lentzea sp. NPDC042327 TaxID=3154801 RepID=UPI0033D7EF93